MHAAEAASGNLLEPVQTAQRCHQPLQGRGRPLLANTHLLCGLQPDHTLRQLGPQAQAFGIRQGQDQGLYW